MTSRERVITALNHQQPDRCPVDLGATAVSGMNISTLTKLREALGLDSHAVKAIEPFQMLGEIEEDLKKAIHCDVVGLWNSGNMMGFSQDTWKTFTMDDGTELLIGSGFACDIMENGNRMVYACGDRSAKYAQCMTKNGSFFDNIDHFDEPFNWDAEEEDLTPQEDFKDDFPIATDEEARYWEEQSKNLYENTEYAVIGCLGGAGFGDVARIPGPSLKDPHGIRTIPDWLAAHVLFPDYIEETFCMQEEAMMKNLEIYRQAVGDRIQAIYVSGTDFSNQNTTFMSLELFRKLYRPHYERINDWIHKNTNWKTFYHSCGNVTNLLDDFCEMGVDILNPVQLSAMEPSGMTAQKLKEQYGSRLVFWGGGVDTQHTLPFGTPGEVRAQVAKRVEILNQGGGYIFNPIHNVVAGVPVENIIAMYEAVLKEKLR